MKHSSFRGECRGTNNDPRYADEVRDIGRIEVSDGNLRNGGVQKKLVFGYGNVASFL